VFNTFREESTVDPQTATILAKYLGAGLAMIGTIGAGIGIGLSVGGAVQAMGRNPDATSTIQTNMILGVAFAEAVAIYCLVVSLILLFVIQ
jgi:F-type H+-transporting ATPase subunit c